MAAREHGGSEGGEQAQWVSAVTAPPHKGLRVCRWLGAALPPPSPPFPSLPLPSPPLLSALVLSVTRGLTEKPLPWMSSLGGRLHPGPFSRFPSRCLSLLQVRTVSVALCCPVSRPRHPWSCSFPPTRCPDPSPWRAPPTAAPWSPVGHGPSPTLDFCLWRVPTSFWVPHFL